MRDFVRRTADLVGEGISQIVLTLGLADAAAASAKQSDRKKVNEISGIILDVVGFILDNLPTFINFMADDFEGLLNVLTSLHLRSSPEVLARAFRYQKEIYNLFWNQEALQSRWSNSAAVFERVRVFADNHTKLYFTCENIFFQRRLTRFHPQVL
jgi:hypothetical protein